MPQLSRFPPCGPGRNSAANCGPSRRACGCQGDGSASPAFGERAAYLAAGAFRAFAQQISGVEDIKALLLRAHGDIAAASAAQNAASRRHVIPSCMHLKPAGTSV